MIERRYALVRETHVRFTLVDIAKLILGEEFDSGREISLQIDDGNQRGSVNPAATFVLTLFNRSETDAPPDPPAAVPPQPTEIV